MRLASYEYDDEVNSYFSRDQLVWAKVVGYPWWPAIIQSKPNCKESHFRVDFIGDNTHAFLHPSKLAKYSDFRKYHITSKKCNNKLIRAVDRADKLFEVYSQVSKNSKGSNFQVEGIPQQKQQQNKQYIQTYEEIEQSQQSQQEQDKLQHITEPKIVEEESQSSIIEDKQIIMEKLLTKYKLDTVPKLSNPIQDKLSSKTSILLKKHKNIKKDSKQRKLNYKKNQICNRYKNNKKLMTDKELLSRKLYSLMKLKCISQKNNFHSIAIYLSEQILSQKESKIQLFRKLIKWIWISSGDIIMKFYSQWGTFQENQKQRASQMTNQ